MNTYYTLIAEDNMISLQSHFYRVEIGSTKAAHRALFTLSGYCSSKGYYFQKRCREDDFFRLKVAKSLGVKVYELPCMDAKVENLVSHLSKHGSLPFIPEDSHNLRYIKAQTEPTFFLSCNTSCLKRGSL